MICRKLAISNRPQAGLAHIVTIRAFWAKRISVDIMRQTQLVTKQCGMMQIKPGFDKLPLDRHTIKRHQNF